MHKKLAYLKHLLAAVFLMVWLPVYADFQAGVDAFDAGYYAIAFKEWKPLAEQGDVDAQHNLGLMYRKGLGVPRDFKEAAKWYRKVAEQGDARGQYNLGLMYENGVGVPQDYKEAAKLYRKAAEQGFPFAQTNLGAMYGNGEGVPQNYIECYAWNSIAAVIGDEDAKINRDLCASNLSPEILVKAEEKAAEYWEMYGN